MGFQKDMYLAQSRHYGNLALEVISGAYGGPGLAGRYARIAAQYARRYLESRF